MIDEDEFDDEPEVDAQGEVVVALDNRRARRVRDDALDEWFHTTPLLVIEALMDLLSGKAISPDVDRVSVPYFRALVDIVK